MGGNFEGRRVGAKTLKITQHATLDRCIALSAPSMSAAEEEEEERRTGSLFPEGMQSKESTKAKKRRRKSSKGEEELQPELHDDQLQRKQKLLKGETSLLNEAMAPETGNGQALQDNAITNNTRTRKKKKREKPMHDRWGQKLQAALTYESDISLNGEKSCSNQQYEHNKVCVGGMPYDVTEEDIHKFFADCGSITELDCLTFKDSGRFNGLAFVTFKTKDAAKRALKLDGASMGGRFLKIDRCRLKMEQPKKKAFSKDPPKKVEGCCSVYIGNLAWGITKIDIERFFSSCKIKAVRLALDKKSGEFRGFGHVDFADDESLEKAVKLDQMELLGRPIKVAYAVAKCLVGWSRRQE